MSAGLITSDIAIAQGDNGTTTTESGSGLPLGIVCVVIVLAGGSALWVYQDAQARGGNGCLWALVVYFVVWPFSLIGYFLFRPND